MTSSTHRLITTASAVLLAAVALGALANSADAKDPMKAFKGKIVVSEDPISVTEDEESFPDYLNGIDTDKLKVEGDKYEFNFLAFLNKKVGASQCQVVLYRKAGKKWEYVNNIPHAINPDQTTLLSALVLSKGSYPAGEYEIRVTRLKSGKEIVFARKKLQLM